MYFPFSLSQFQTAVASLSCSSIFAVRELAAQALIPLIPQDQVADTLTDIIRSLPGTPQDADSFNNLHGCLLQVDKLTDEIIRR